MLAAIDRIIEVDMGSSITVKNEVEIVKLTADLTVRP